MTRLKVISNHYFVFTSPELTKPWQEQIAVRRIRWKLWFMCAINGNMFN